VFEAETPRQSEAATANELVRFYDQMELIARKDLPS
jgi:hypothetical protein